VGQRASCHSHPGQGGPGHPRRQTGRSCRPRPRRLLCTSGRPSAMYSAPSTRGCRHATYLYLLFFSASWGGGVLARIVQAQILKQKKSYHSRLSFQPCIVLIPLAIAAVMCHPGTNFSFPSLLRSTSHTHSLPSSHSSEGPLASRSQADTARPPQRSCGRCHLGAPPPLLFLAFDFAGLAGRTASGRLAFRDAASKEMVTV